MPDPQVGLHVSSAGSLDLSFDRAVEIGATTFQIFTRNPNQWKFKPIPEETLALFREKRKKLGFRRVVDHMPYLPNLATSDKTIQAVSRDILDAEVARCDQLGIDYLVIHLGSHKGVGTVIGVRNIAAAVNEALKKSDGETMILLENMAGQKNSVGARFEDLALIVDGVKQRERVGVCFDTCLPPGSFVLGEGTPLRIDNIRVGDRVSGIDGFATQVTRVIRRPFSGELILVKPKGLPWMPMTPEHPLLYIGVNRVKNLDEAPWRIKLIDDPVWVRAKNVTKGNYLVLPKLRTEVVSQIDFRRYVGSHTRRLPFPSVLPMTIELAEFLGLYLAEGFVFIGKGERGGDNAKIYLSFGKHEKELIKRAMGLFEQIFSLKAWTDEGETAVKVVAGSNILARFLRDSFGPNAREKRIPTFIMSAEDSVVRSFILSYRKGDGCVDEDGVRFVTSSEVVAIQLVHLLARIDIHATHQWHGPTKSQIKGRVLNGRGWYTIHVARAEAKKLGFDFHLPTLPQRTFLRKGNDFLVPIGEVMRSRYEGEVVNITTESGSFLAPFVVTHNCHAYAAGFDLTGRESVERTMEVFDQCVGYDRLKVVHLNDSKGDLGSNQDRHENVGKGKIGAKGMKAILHYKGITERPLIMETPFADLKAMRRSLAFVRRLLQ